MAIASLILGIVSLVIAVFGFFAGPLAIAALVMGITGIVLAGISIKKQKKGTGGLVCSILATVFSFIPAIIWFALLAASVAA